MASSTIHSSLNWTKAHLQKQLRQKDADCNRMAVQIRVNDTTAQQSFIQPLPQTVGGDMKAAGGNAVWPRESVL